ncbi:hypothetical protein OAU50_07405 [Planctomycetota bacterium]|nr:hypothetical protein [Planctomycetota bacterium]
MNNPVPPNQQPQGYGQPQSPVPPQGYNQQPQQQPMPPHGAYPQGQPYPPQQGYPPYSPPPKKSNFVLILVLVGVFVFIPFVGCLGLAAIPLITENASDARRAEGEAIAGSIKTHLRTTYAKSGQIPTTNDPEVQRILMENGSGEYVASVDYMPTGGDSGQLTVRMVNPADGEMTMTFDFNTGDSTPYIWTR